MANTERPSSRRALLGGAVAGAVALGFRVVAGPDAARAGGQPPLLKNIPNGVSAATGIVLDPDDKLQVYFVDVDTAVFARSEVNVGYGVDALVDGAGGTAVRARTLGDSTQTALLADVSAGYGEGYAVKAITKNGAALYGEAVGGNALQVQGVSVFSRSGSVRFAQGSSSKTVVLSGKGNYITGNSLVLATIQGDVAGVWVRGCTHSTAANSITIRLNKAAPVELHVGWFVVN